MNVNILASSSGWYKISDTVMRLEVFSSGQALTRVAGLSGTASATEIANQQFALMSRQL
jgi:hypothetical protein